MDPTAELDGSVASMSLSEAGSIDAGGSTAGSSRSSTELRREQAQIDSDLLEIPFEQFSALTKIGRGSFGEVYRCKYHGTDVAVKVLNDQGLNEENLKEFRSEVNMMSKMRHPNVVLLMGISSKQPHLAIVTEYCARGSLFRLLHHTDIALDIRRRVKMAIDIAKGMTYLHSATPAIVHRDLKSPNLLVDESFTVKICDFGLARLKHETFVQTVNGCAGTPNYMAPEVLRNEPFNEKCDVFSMGVILWELVQRREPYKKMQPLQVISAVVFQGQRLPQPKDCDPELVALIDRCWAADSTVRPSFYAIQEMLQEVFARYIQSAQTQKTVVQVGSSQ